MNTSSEPRRDRILAIWVFLAAVLFHVLPWFQYGADPFSQTLISDAMSYDEWATQVAAQGLARQPVFHQAPLYPVVVSWVYAAVPAAARHTAVIALQILITSAALASLVFLSRGFLKDPLAGVAGAGLAIFHGPFVFHSLKLFPVALALGTQAGALAFLVAARRRPNLGMCLGAGAALGVAALARAEVLLFVPLAAIAVAVSRPRGGGRAGAAIGVLVGALVGTSPATIHNLNQGDFVLVASSGGENLFIGNKRGAEGDYTPLHPKAGDLLSERLLAQQLADAEVGRSLRPSEVSAFWRSKAIAEIAAAPRAWLRLEAKKLGKILDPGDPNDSYSFPLERGRYLSSLWLLSLPAWTLLGLGGWGVVLALRRIPGPAWPLAAFLTVQAATLLIFFVNTRLRLPLLFFAAPFAGLALLELWCLFRTRRTVAGLCGAALVLGLTVAGCLRTTPSPRDALRLASVLSIQGRLDEGLAVLAPYLDAKPPYATALDQAGWLLQKKGSYAEAAGRYQEALAAGLAPGRAVQTRTRLALALEKSGDAPAALAEHDRAASDPEANAGTFYERGMFRLRQGDRNGANADLARAIRLDPSWPPPQDALKRITSAVATSPAIPPQSSELPD